MTYLDTSALIKRFVTERGSDLVSHIVVREGPVATATIAYVEVYAGLTRRHRGGDVSSRQFARACREFEDDWPGYVRVDLGEEILPVARDLVQRHALRGFDAIHLASAVRLKDSLGEEVRFVAADERLLQAAARERLPVVNVERAARS